MARAAQRPLVLKIAITVVASGAIVFKAVFPEWEVDAVTLGLFVVGILPWLAPLIKSVELPGGLKVELQEIKDSVEETKGAVASVRQRAEFAVIQAETSAARPAEVMPKKSVEDWAKGAEALVQEYNRVRAEMPSGPARTLRMTGIVTRMIDAAYGNPAWDVGAHFKNPDRGWRLMAYAFAYARPDFAFFPTLVASACDLADDNLPFGQYWSILAIQRALGLRGQLAVSLREKSRLEEFFRWLVAGTDRHEEMRRVIESLKGVART